MTSSTSKTPLSFWGARPTKSPHRESAHAARNPEPSAIFVYEGHTKTKKAVLLSFLPIPYSLLLIPFLLLSTTAQAACPTGDCTQMTISNTTGNVGIGTSSPNATLDVSGTAKFRGFSFYFDANPNNGIGQQFATYSWDTMYIIANVDSSGNWQVDNFRVYDTGNAYLRGTLTQNSDARLKTNIHPLPKALEKLELIQGVTFNWKDKQRDQRQQIDVIAQDVEKAYPQLVSTDPSGTKSFNYSGLVAPLIEAIKELKTQNDTLRQEFETYKKTHP